MSSHTGVFGQACHEIDFANQIILDERIGSGAFGSVYRGERRAITVEELGTLALLAKPTLLRVSARSTGT